MHNKETQLGNLTVLRGSSDRTECNAEAAAPCYIGCASPIMHLMVWHWHCKVRPIRPDEGDHAKQSTEWRVVEYTLHWM